MSGLRALTSLPEWSSFFGALCAQGCLRLRWREVEGGWTAQAYEHTRDLDQPLGEVPLGPMIEGPDQFEVIRLALDGCGRKIKQATWETFFAFRAAATGTAGTIEDLL